MSDIRADFAALRSLGFAAIGAGYAAVGAAIIKRIMVIKLYNGTDQAVYYSNDGTNDKDILPPGAFFVVDVTANEVKNDGFFFAAGETWSVKHAGVAPTAGSFYITIVEEA